MLMKENICYFKIYFFWAINVSNHFIPPMGVLVESDWILRRQSLITVYILILYIVFMEVIPLNPTNLFLRFQIHSIRCSLSIILRPSLQPVHSSPGCDGIGVVWWSNPPETNLPRSFIFRKWNTETSMTLFIFYIHNI